MKTSLRQQGKVDFHPQPEIEDSIRGVEFDYFYTGKRQGSSRIQIELHITSTVRDWNDNVYIRKAWYMGHKDHWKKCIEDHVRQHLLDLSTGPMLVMRMMQDFEVTEDKYKPWDKYKASRIEVVKNGMSGGNSYH